MAAAVRAHLPGAAGHAGEAVERAQLAVAVAGRGEDHRAVGLGQARVSPAKGMHQGRRQAQHAGPAQQPFGALGQQPRPADPVVDGLGVAGPHDDARAVVVAQVGAHAGQVMRHRHAQALQQPGRADAGQLQQLGRIDGAGADDHLAPGLQLKAGAAALVAQAARDAAVQHDGADLRIGDHRQVGAAHRRVEKGARRADAPLALDHPLVVAHALGAGAVVVGPGRQAQAGGAVDEGIAQHMAPGRVGHRQFAQAAAVVVVGGANAALDALEIGQHIAVGPTGIAALGPAVVVGWLAAHEDHAVDRA